MRTFKVVWVNNGRRMSTAAHGNVYLRKQYTTEDWTIADIGGLLSFQSYKHAIGFYESLPYSAQFEIWESEVEDPVRLGLCAVSVVALTPKRAREYWMQEDSYNRWPI